MKRALIHIILFIACFHAAAQVDYNTLPEARLKRLLNEAQIQGDRYAVVDIYKVLATKNPANFQFTFNYAESLRGIHNYVKAKAIYKRILDNGKEKFPISEYYYGVMQMQTEDYEGAIKTFDDFKKSYKEDDATAYKKKVKEHVKGCEAAIAARENPTNIEIELVDGSVNKAYSEYSPIMVGDTGLIYASRKAKQMIKYDVDDKPEFLPRSRFYKANWIENEWVVRGNLKGPFNDLGYEVGNGAFNLDGSRFYFTKCNRNEDNVMQCQLYYSNFSDSLKTWSAVVKLPENVNLEGFTTTQPTVGKNLKTNEEVVYFVSDRPGGIGGLDIWYTARDRFGDYSDPINLNRKVNTQYNEMTPFFDVGSSTLFYSSEGWNSSGGYDVYKTQGQLAKWVKPSSMGFPINSGADDIYYVTNKAQSAGFMVSNRPGGMALKHETCCDDIYSFTYPDRLEFIVEGEVKDPEDTSNTPLENAIVSLYLLGESTCGDPNHDKAYCEEHGCDMEILLNRQKVSDLGEYEFNLMAEQNYKVTVYNQGYLNDDFAISTKGLIYSERFLRNFLINKISDSAVVIKNIYYGYDSAHLSTASKRQIDSVLVPLMKQNTHIVVEIGSHTDNHGSHQYNQVLSYDRARSVVLYLRDQGIDQKRIYAKGYGETVPIADNQFPDGTDNPEGRALNRRTEFRITGEVPNYKRINYGL